MYSEEVIFYDCGGNRLESAVCDQEEFCTDFGAISQQDYFKLNFDTRWNCGQQLSPPSSLEEHFVEKPKLTREHFTVYPNPFFDDFYFEKSANMNLSTLRILNARGQLVQFNLEKGSHHVHIQPLNWLPGIYFLSIQEKNGVYFSKVVYQN